MFLNCKEPSKVLERSIGAYKFERKGGRDGGGRAHLAKTPSK